MARKEDPGADFTIVGVGASAGGPVRRQVYRKKAATRRHRTWMCSARRSSRRRSRRLQFNLIPSDIGRPLSQISTTLQCPELAALITETIDTVSPVDNRIDGAVIALFDLDPAKK